MSVTNVVLAGVGGQGSILATQVLGVLGRHDGVRGGLEHQQRGGQRAQRLAQRLLLEVLEEGGGERDRALTELHRGALPHRCCAEPAQEVRMAGRVERGHCAHRGQPRRRAG